MIHFAADVCRDLAASERREWLETNGLGGYASSTLSGMNTRRYHSLLMAAIRPPTERFALLSKLEETLFLEAERVELSTNRYPQVIHPRGYLLQTGFRLDPFPVFTYRVGEIEIEKAVFMLHGENTTVVRYRLTSSPRETLPVTLEVRPLVAFRHYHYLAREGVQRFSRLQIEPGLLRLAAAPSAAASATPDNAAALFFAHDAERILVEELWYRNFEYAEERARGFDYREDLFNPCALVFNLQEGDAARLIASTERHAASEAEAFEERERRRRALIAPDVAAQMADAMMQTPALTVQKEASETAEPAEEAGATEVGDDGGSARAGGDEEASAKDDGVSAGGDVVSAEGDGVFAEGDEFVAERTEDESLAEGAEASSQHSSQVLARPDGPPVGRDEYVRALRLAADQFIVRRGPDLHSVIAGYHWFTDWGRDTMISLVGLTLTTSRFDTAREILLAFAAHLKEGLIPNLFLDEGGHPEYNTVDATLWFVHAVGELLRRTGDEQFVGEHFYECLKEIIRRHEQGTLYGIGVDREDHLLRAGEEGVQLTWMDAKVGERVVTPRVGKAVEIQALWYNALRIVEEMAARFRDTRTRDRCRASADGMRASFNGHFWNSEARCLFDYIKDDGTPDESIRPNQILAVSLPHPLLTGRRAQQVVETVARELLTPYGLRTLSPRDPAYRGRYEGDAAARDAAYHQGTVWAWLMGPFITAYLRVNNRTDESLLTARRWLSPLREHLFDAGLGQISEIFDGDAPHTPRGCIAQAWSIAELLRCELEELA